MLWSLTSILWSYELLQSEPDSGTDANSKARLIVTIVIGWKPWTIVAKGSILDFAPVQNPPLGMFLICYFTVPIVCDVMLFLDVILLLIFRYKNIIVVYKQPGTGFMFNSLILYV